VLARVVTFAVLALLAASCATTGDGGGGVINPDDVKPGAPASALSLVTLCKSTYDDVKKALGGEPYREGVVHKLKARTWKLAPARRKGEPALVAFDEHDVAVDVCFDLPGAAKCEIVNQCEVKP
jgi:hypothetical protein